MQVLHGQVLGCACIDISCILSKLLQDLPPLSNLFPQSISEWILCRNGVGFCMFE